MEIRPAIHYPEFKKLIIQFISTLATSPEYPNGLYDLGYHFTRVEYADWKDDPSYTNGATIDIPIQPTDGKASSLEFYRQERIEAKAQQNALTLYKEFLLEIIGPTIKATLADAATGLTTVKYVDILDHMAKHYDHLSADDQAFMENQLKIYDNSSPLAVNLANFDNIHQILAAKKTPVHDVNKRRYLKEAVSKIAPLSYQMAHYGLQYPDESSHTYADICTYLKNLDRHAITHADLGYTSLPSISATVSLPTDLPANLAFVNAALTKEIQQLRKEKAKGGWSQVPTSTRDPTMCGKCAKIKDLPAIKYADCKHHNPKFSTK